MLAGQLRAWSLGDLKAVNSNSGSTDDFPRDPERMHFIS